MFLFFASLFLFLNIWLWARFSTMLRGTRPRRLWQSLLSAWLVLMFVGLFTSLTVMRYASQGRHWAPSWGWAAIYIWHLLILPLTALIAIISAAVASGIRKMRRPVEAAPPRSINASVPTRRDFLKIAAIAAPPLATLSLAGVAMEQLGKFRITPYHLPVAGWPAEMDGFTIAVVADVHTGVFSTPQMLRDIVQRTNDLRPDLTLLAGDLVNISLRDLPGALDMAMQLNARHGVYMIQGNHDVIEDAAAFNQRCRARGVRLLLDEIQTLNTAAPVQLFGTIWPTSRLKGDPMRDSINKMMQARDPDAFPIVLAHHPHTWDPARERQLPLVISGHTHGGQIMLTKRIGAGPLRFKYWTGHYQADNSHLIVSNGVGNWFPVRYNAPAEILHITMHPA